MNKQRNLVWIALALLGAAIVISLVVGTIATSGGAFLGSYKGMQKNYQALQTSAHQGLKCEQCHSGGVTYKVAMLGDFYRGLLSKPRDPRFTTLKKPTSEACIACHKYDWTTGLAKAKTVPHPAHLRVANEKRDCVTCHKWTAHQEDYMEKHKEMRYSSVCASYECHVGTKQPDECSNCHHSIRESREEWRVEHSKVVQEAGPNSCLETCHDAEQCRQCHITGKTPDFGASAAHPGLTEMEREHVKDGWMDRHGELASQDEGKCLTCHVSVGECEDCHEKRPASHGLKATWLGRHKAPGKDAKRCTACHEREWCEACHQKFKEWR